MSNAGSLQLSGYGVDNVKIGRQVAIKYNDEQGNCTQSVKFNGNANDTQEINFNADTKAHQAFMSIVGSDNIFDINDLENLKGKVSQYGAKVDDSNLKETGAVTISFADGKSLSIDFWTDKELEEFKDHTTDTMTKMAKSLIHKAKPAFQWLEKAGEAAWKWYDDTFNTVMDRLEAWKNANP